MLAACAHAQDQLTPPIQPKLAPVETPPVVTLPIPPGTLVVQTPITAEDAGRVALQHQPQIALAQAAILQAHGNYLEAAQDLIPNINLGATYTHEITSSDFGGKGSTVVQNGVPQEPNTFLANASLTQLLFDFGRTIDAARALQAQQKAADYGLTVAQSNSVYQVKQDYYSYVQAQGQVTVAEENLKDRQDNLALAKARLNSGLGVPGDVVTAQTNLASAMLTLVSSRNSVEVAEVKLALDMGIDPRTPITTKESAERPVPSQDVNAMVDIALKQRPEVLQDLALLKSAGYEVAVARKALLPSISLSASTDWPIWNQGIPQTGTVAIQLTWNPLNILGARGQNDVAQAGVMTAKANLQTASQTVVSDVSQAFLNVKYAEQSVATSESEVANAQEGLRLAEGQYKAGVAVYVTVEDAEANLAQARSDLVNAQAAEQLGLSQMEHALGQSL